MKVAGGVLGIIGGAINTIFAYVAWAAASALVAVGQEIAAEAGASSAEIASFTSDSGAGAAVTYLLIYLLVSVAMIGSGIMALVMNSARLAGIIMLVCVVISFLMAGLVGIIGIILGIIGGILALMAAPKQDMSA
ncbi:MAG: hypothetical protein ACO3TT_05340 [Candidatus Puniceispirillales bacterium]|jgi:hypothetical protein